MSDADNAAGGRPAEPAAQSEDLESILGTGGGSSSTEQVVGAMSFNRYHVEFEGNSSEDEAVERGVDERTDQLDGAGEEGEEGKDEEEDDERMTDANYLPLVADEFGDFVCAEDFGDYYEELGNSQPQEVDADSEAEGDTGAGALAETSARAAVGEEKRTSSAEQVQQQQEQQPDPPRISIAPLDASKILQIKAAMAGVRIGAPNLGAMSMADLLEGRKLRLGDEIVHKT
ncbi:hypothetical protein B484DRAFT_450628 [Ochromonadaceae sp. CCMP2298]|nr:hypothetical protein B484DRAFT_450628 [Ochromonadaceae sp. CCMP2298]|mmetsp:Transcript_30383/g.67203  ORF Transcript_30383/g.67203 Transcript_30383/m.67203 type:complete len:230 (-) Transcript_30383:372-1061(-)